MKISGIVFLILSMFFQIPLYTQEDTYKDVSIVQTFDPLIDNIVEKLPSLDILIDSAIQNSPYIRYENAEISLSHYRIKEARWNWTRLLGVEMNYKYGNLSQFSTSQTSGSFPTDFTSDRSENYYNIGAFLKIPIFDVINQKNGVNIAKRELEKRLLRQEQIIRETKQDIIFVYEDLLLRQELLKIKNESRLTTELQVQMAEKEFLNGQITIAELSRLTEIHSINIADFTKQKSLFYRQYLILEELVGIKFNLLNKIY